MKKIFILFLLAICSSIIVSADTLKPFDKINPKQISKSAINTPLPKQDLDFTPCNSAISKNRRLTNKSKIAASSQKSLYGTYLEDYNYEDKGLVYSFHVSIEPYEVTDDSGQTISRIKLSNAYTGWGETVIADISSTEEGKITVPANQVVGVYNDQYPLYLFAAYSNDDGFDIATGRSEKYIDLTYTVKEDENGSYLSLDNEGWVILAYDPDSESFLGYVNYSLDGHVLNSANAKISYNVSVPISSDWSDWEEKEDDVYVEYFDGGCKVHGFFEQYILKFNLDAESKQAKIPNCQPLYYYSSNDLMYSFYAIHDNQIDCTDKSYESVGYFEPSTGQILMYDYNSSTGEDYEWDYFAFCTPYEESVGAYWKGKISCLEVLPNDIFNNPNSENDTYDFTNPTTLNPTINPSEDEDSYVDVSQSEFSLEDNSLSFGLGTRSTYCARIWTNGNLENEIRLYKGSELYIKAKEERRVTNILFTGANTNAMSVSTGIFNNGTWKGNSDVVTFYINETTNIYSIKVITSEALLEKITISSEFDELLIGESIQLTAALYPKFTTQKEITWTSSNGDIATVDENGNVTALKKGTVTITATSVNNPSISGSIILNVTYPMCETPEISVVNNKIVLSCKIPDAKFYSTISYPISDEIEGESLQIKPIVTISTYAIADKYEKSALATKNIDLRDLFGGDINKDTKISIEDVTKLVNVLLKIESLDASE